MNRMATAPARALPSWLSLASRTAVAARAPPRRWAAPAAPADSMRTASTGFFGGVPRAAAVASVGVGRLQFGAGGISGGIVGAQPVRWKVTNKQKQAKIDNEVNLPGNCHPQHRPCVAWAAETHACRVSQGAFLTSLWSACAQPALHHLHVSLAAPHQHTLRPRSPPSALPTPRSSPALGGERGRGVC